LEAGDRRQEAEGKRKKEGARRSVFTNMRCSLFRVDFPSKIYNRKIYL
jgi:hypothetical protein